MSRLKLQCREIMVLEQLLVLNDLEFVRAVYKALLKREADAAGEQTYLALLRGGVDKLVLIRDIAESDEGRRLAAVVPGLRRALRLRRLGRVPLLGPLARRMAAWLMREPEHDPQSAFRNQSLGVQRATLDRLTRFQAATADQLRVLENSLQRLVEQQELMNDAVVSMRDELDWLARRPTGAGADTGPAAAGLAPSGGWSPAPREHDGSRSVRSQLVRKAAAWKT